MQHWALSLNSAHSKLYPKGILTLVRNNIDAIQIRQYKDDSKYEVLSLRKHEIDLWTPTLQVTKPLLQSFILDAGTPHQPLVLPYVQATYTKMFRWAQISAEYTDEPKTRDLDHSPPS